MNHTPTPWRWGFWKWRPETRDREFRPMSEAEGFDEDFFELVGVEYGSVAEEFHCSAHVLSATVNGADDGVLDISPENCAFVELAVNTHDGLVAACKAALARVDSEILWSGMDVELPCQALATQLRKALEQAGEKA